MTILVNSFIRSVIEKSHEWHNLPYGTKYNIPQGGSIYVGQLTWARKQQFIIGHIPSHHGLSNVMYLLTFSKKHS